MSTYGAVHARLAREYGQASEYDCPCGLPAEQWAYVGPRAPGERKPYSPNLTMYRAMCGACHRHYDQRVLALLDAVTDGVLW